MREIKKLPHIAARSSDAFKSDFGKILIIAGSRGMTGAGVLTAEAALRSGAGLVTLALPNSEEAIATSRLTPAAMTCPLPSTSDGSLSLNSEDKLLHMAESFDVVALGPGLSQNLETQALVQSLVLKIEKPLVIDADGLNALVNKEFLNQRHQPTILTPHPGEFSKLTGSTIKEIREAPLKVAQKFCESFNVTLVLKVAPSLVINQSKYYQNNTGNPGMATAGSGDVLVGIISALLGQNLDAFSAAELGVYIHGLAGDLARDKFGEISMTSTDIVDSLFEVFKKNTSDKA